MVNRESAWIGFWFWDNNVRMLKRMLKYRDKSTSKVRKTAKIKHWHQGKASRYGQSSGKHVFTKTLKFTTNVSWLAGAYIHLRYVPLHKIPTYSLASKTRNKLFQQAPQLAKGIRKRTFTACAKIKTKEMGQLVHLWRKDFCRSMLPKNSQPYSNFPTDSKKWHLCMGFSTHRLWDNSVFNQSRPQAK